MAELRVTCVVSDNSDDDYRIQGIGGGDNHFNAWYHPIDQAIRNIECRSHRYFTSHGGKSAWVIVKVHPSTGRKYLTTEPDGYSANNLSRLQSCRLAA